MQNLHFQKWDKELKSGTHVTNKGGFKLQVRWNLPLGESEVLSTFSSLVPDGAQPLHRGEEWREGFRAFPTT